MNIITSTIQDSDVHTRIERRGDRVLSTLENLYAKARPQIAAGGFKTRVFDRLYEHLLRHPNVILHEDGSFDAPVLESLILEVEELPVGVDVWFIYASCAYAIAAVHAVEVEDETRCWEMLADANYHLGWAAALGQGQAVTDEVFRREAASARSRAGTTARHRKTNEMKAWAYEYVRGQANWPSQASAVVDLEQRLRAEYGEKCLKDFEGTITKWLRDMPDREQHFKTVGANRRKP